jgi:hypothetical protein
MPETGRGTADGPEHLIRAEPQAVGADVDPAAGQGRWPTRLRAHAGLVGVLLAYLASGLVVHPLAPVAVSDDWVYARSVEILFAEHALRILPLTVTTLVFQVFWGSLFVKVFGLSFGVLRMSTVVLVVLGGWAFYGLCRQLEVSHRWSALGTAVFLFNPLTYALSFTYMSDGGFASLMVISLYLFVRGLGPAEVAARWVVAGSAVAALAFLQRQQGALIPAAVVIYLLLAGRLWPLRRGVALVASVAVVPMVAMAGYYYWLFEAHGVPLYQKLFVDHIKEVGRRGALLQVGRLSFISMMYLGLFVLPLVVGAVPGVRRLARSASAVTWAVVGLAAAVIAVGVTRFGEGRPRMPYIPDFLNASGIGPVQQIRGQRPALVGRGFLTVLTGLCALGALALTLIVLRRISGRPRAAPGMAGLVVTFLVLQAAGTLPSSFSFFNWQVDGLPSPSLDRYLLPLLPLAVVLVLWALRAVRFSLGAAWAVTAVVGLFAVAGTRDSMVRQEAVWRLADATADSGVAPFHIDGGAAWSGYRLFDYSVTNPIPPPPGDSPWWVFVFAPAVDGTYVVGGRPLPGYDVVRTVPLSSWLEPRPARLYLLKRQGGPAVP